MRIGIVTAVWKRPEVFEMFAKGVLHLNNNTEHEYFVIVAGSEGYKTKNMVEKYGFNYIEIPNNPLATKHNATTIEAKEYDPDYILFLGSDDVIGVELMNLYTKFMKRSIDFIGLKDLYFYDIETDYSSYWGGYVDSRFGCSAGAGRLISKRLMNLWEWSVFEIKDNNGFYFRSY